MTNFTVIIWPADGLELLGARPSADKNDYYIISIMENSQKTSYLILTGMLWGVYCEYYGEYWAYYNVLHCILKEGLYIETGP